MVIYVLNIFNFKSFGKFKLANGKNRIGFIPQI